jgi:uncharacterized protein YeaO (DUF488 family)
MAIRIVRLGNARNQDEGYASAHREAAAARRAQGKIISSLPNYDAWMPDLAPSAELVSWAVSEPFTPEAVFSIRASLPARNAPAGPRSALSHCSQHYHHRRILRCAATVKTRRLSSLGLRQLFLEHGARLA